MKRERERSDTNTKQRESQTTNSVWERTEGVWKTPRGALDWTEREQPQNKRYCTPSDTHTDAAAMAAVMAAAMAPTMAPAMAAAAAAMALLALVAMAPATAAVHDAAAMKADGEGDGGKCAAVMGDERYDRLGALVALCCYQL